MNVNIMLAGANMNIVALFLRASCLLLLRESHAFVHPVMQSSTIRVASPTSSLSALPEFNPFLLADGLSAATRYGGGGFESDVFADPAVTSALSTLRTFFIVLTAAAFGLTALAYITAAFIVPKAAEQLENDTRRLRPGLWEEYEAKLEDNETMATRPGEYRNTYLFSLLVGFFECVLKLIPMIYIHILPLYNRFASRTW